jgi:5-bromo-4-chloroindolyl phosphate hydrolysis protein
MKNKEIASAAIGGVFFAVPYLGLAIPLLPSLLIGAAAFGAGELAFGENKLTLKDKDPSLYFVLEKAKKQNKHILDMIPKIENENIQKELNEINDSVTKIIDTIEKEPKKLKKVNNFFEYYLPVTIKIVDRYDEIENQKLSSAESKKFFESTDKMIKEINKSYKKILAELYKSDIVDMDAEMKVFNSLLKADGFNDAEFPLKKEEKEDE